MTEVNLSEVGGLAGLTLRASESSISCPGIQLADAVAHSLGQVVRATFPGQSKTVAIGGPGTGYPDNVMAPLAWSLLMHLRYALVARPLAYEGRPYDPDTGPIVVGPDDDPVNLGQNPEMIGWGVQIANGVSEEVQDNVRAALGHIWLGCIH